jgi:protein involved in polysaccharide export with SLBB domain
MKTPTLLFAAIFAAAGCSSPAPQTQQASSSAQTQLNPPSPYVYIHGEFRMPGRYAWTNGMTLQDVFNSAHGFTDFAGHNLRVNHRDGSSTIYRLDSKMHLTNNLPVSPGDTIVCRGAFL